MVFCAGCDKTASGPIDSGGMLVMPQAGQLTLLRSGTGALKIEAMICGLLNRHADVSMDLDFADKICNLRIRPSTASKP
jgi:hypothetical protein